MSVYFTRQSMYSLHSTSTVYLDIFLLDIYTQYLKWLPSNKFLATALCLKVLSVFVLNRESFNSLYSRILYLRVWKMYKEECIGSTRTASVSTSTIYSYSM